METPRRRATPSRSRRSERGIKTILPHGTHTGTPIAKYSLGGCNITENVYGPGDRSHRHAHASPFFTATLAGESLAEIDSIDAVRSIAGDVHFIPAGVEHSHRISEVGLRGIAVDLAPEYAAAFAEHGVDLTRPFILTDPRVARLARRLQQEIRDPDPLSHLQIDALVGEICVTLIRNERRRRALAAPRWLRKLVVIVHERYREDLSLESLAAEANVHPVHVSRAFHQYYGETLRDYVRRLRLAEARRLLESSRSIAEIAAEVGYHDESHLSKAFKLVVGTTPGQYRGAVRSSSRLAF